MIHAWFNMVWHQCRKHRHDGLCECACGATHLQGTP